MIEYQLIRTSRRKTIGLQVKRARVIVRAPHFAKKELIESFLLQKLTWLKKQVAQQVQANSMCCGFAHGDFVYVHGNKLEIRISFTNSNNIYLTESSSKIKYLSIEINSRLKAQLLCPEQRAKHVKKEIELFFKRGATDFIHDRVTLLSQQTLLWPLSIKIRRYSARWGSCNSRGELSFNYLLMMLPDWVIEYVIIHELCHLQHLNHSADFWSLVCQHSPNYTEAIKWLELHQAQLHWALPDSTN